jgi:hypothetical protein
VGRGLLGILRVNVGQKKDRARVIRAKFFRQQKPTKLPTKTNKINKMINSVPTLGRGFVE